MLVSRALASHEMKSLVISRIDSGVFPVELVSSLTDFANDISTIVSTNFIDAIYLTNEEIYEREKKENK